MALDTAALEVRASMYVHPQLPDSLGEHAQTNTWLLRCWKCKYQRKKGREGEELAGVDGLFCSFHETATCREIEHPQSVHWLDDTGLRVDVGVAWPYEEGRQAVGEVVHGGESWERVGLQGGRVGGSGVKENGAGWEGRKGEGGKEQGCSRSEGNWTGHRERSSRRSHSHSLEET